MFFQLLINGIIMGALYSIVSMGFALIYNTTRIFHTYYAALLVIAPYCYFTFSNQLHWGSGYALVASLLICCILSVIGEIFVYRPFQKIHRSGNAIMVASIGLMTIMINVVALIWGNDVKLINTGMIQSSNLAGIIITYSQKLQLAVSIGLILSILLVLRFTRLGLLMRAFRDDDSLFRTLGCGTEFFRTAVFALSGLIAGASGLVYAFDTGIEPYMGIPLFLIALTAIIVGGAGRYEAPVVGGFIIGILQALSIGFVSAKWQNAIIFAILVFFLALRPQGIMGEKERTA